jgi:hypothetical protein
MVLVVVVVVMVAVRPLFCFGVCVEWIGAVRGRELV